MKLGVTNTVIMLVAVMALLVGGAVYRITHPAAMTRDQLNENGLFVYEAPRRFADISLVDHNGEPFTSENLQGHWTLVFFGYTSCPDICPLTMATLGQFTQMLEAETDYAADTEVVMVSVDPERDTQQKLSDYVTFFNEDYTGVTGEYINIFNFARQLNVAFNYIPSGEEGEYEVSHSGEIALINPEGHFHGFFKHPPEPEQMVMTYETVRKTFD